MFRKRPRSWFYSLLALAPATLVGCAYDVGVPGDEGAGETADQAIDSSEQALTFTSLSSPLDMLPLEIQNVGSGKCLDVTGASSDNFARIQQYSCAATKNQTFFFTKTGTNTYQIRAGNAGGKAFTVAAPTDANGAAIVIRDTISSDQIFSVVAQSDGSYQIVSTLSQKCLDVEGYGTQNGAKIQQWDCHGATNQRFVLRVRAQPMNLIAKHSNRCLDVTGASTANSAGIQQYDCNNQGNQRWYLQAAGTLTGVPVFKMVANHSGKCLDVIAGSTADGAKLQQYTCNDNDQQKWWFEGMSDGYAVLHNVKSGKCLDVTGISTSNGAVLQQYSCTGGANQRWYWSMTSPNSPHHVHFVNVADKGGGGALVVTDLAIQQHVARLNGIYRPYGLTLVYDPATDRAATVASEGLYRLSGSPNEYECPIGAKASSVDCAVRYAAQWPDKVVLFSRPGSDSFTSGGANFIVLFQIDANAKVCDNVTADTRLLAHEFGHYMGLNHTFSGNGDLLADTGPDPSADRCLAPHSPTGTFNGVTVETNNILSYYENDTLVVSGMQSALIRATAYARGW